MDKEKFEKLNRGGRRKVVFTVLRGKKQGSNSIKSKRKKRK